MTGNRKKTAMRVLAVLPYLMALYFLQGVLFSRMKLFGVTPLVLPLAVCGAAIFSGRVYGCVIGILAGMLCDLSFNEPTIVFTLALALLGLAIGAMAETVLQEGIISFAVTGVLTLVFCAFIQSARLIFIDGAPLNEIADVALRQTAVSLIFAPIVYLVSKFIGKVE